MGEIINFYNKRAELNSEWYADLVKLMKDNNEGNVWTQSYMLTLLNW